MSDYTMQLAALGARVMGLWGFDEITDTDELVTHVGDAIYKVGLDYGNTQQVRTICLTHQLAHAAWEDARSGHSGDDEHATAAALIEQLMHQFGLTATYADGSTR
ncbi:MULTISPECIES: hypothetical protein [Leucobacter]|uniref:Uncharacterized protein n=1 Tax=Leucobacter chromiiresistens TaxID=1079994 RepID=A0A1H0YJI0_9MICO|nr:hypothetical protein [Leucobacter chromiiresistens]SDQ15344.1 hypothetical protein SAMN04488565_0935 [Leucobacter chromiiresistens]